MSGNFEIYAIIVLAIFILAFLWRTFKTSGTANTKKKPKQTPLPTTTPFKRNFNAEEVGKRIRRRMKCKLDAE